MISFSQFSDQTVTIAFSAWNITKVTFAGFRAIFADVNVNDGSGFNNTSGYFTAPVPGLYLFSAQLCVNSDSGLYFEVIDDSTDTVICATVFKEKDYSSCTAAQGIARLAEGDRVYLKMPDTYGHLIQVTAYYRCQFTGMRIGP